MERLFDKLGDLIAEEGARVRAVVEAGLTQTANAQWINAARPEPLRANTRNATSRGRLVGWSIRENAATPGPATVTIYAGPDANSDVIASVGLVAGASATHLPSGAGVFFGDGGLFVAVTGSVIGSLYYGAKGGS
jgi:hypothetical protein